MIFDAKVVILEDDPALAAGLTAFLHKHQIEALTTSRTDEAMDWLLKKKVAAIFIDCLLPSENGLDFAQNVRRRFPKDQLDIVLMSGIFTDPTFVKDALRDAEASHFLKKPFNNEEVLACIRRGSPGFSGNLHPRKAFYKIFGKPDANERDKRRAIEDLEEVHGFDLPVIFSLLAEGRMSGHLNLVSESGAVSGVSFSQGHIVAVDVKDTESFLGKLLIESGYILPEDLEEALATNTNQRIGEKLIQGNVLSPHAFDIVLANQMMIRLSRSIGEETLNVNFIASDIPLTAPNIDPDRFSGLLHDWIASKITADWLRAHFTQWVHASFARGPAYQKKSALLKMPLVSHIEGIADTLTSGVTLSEIIESKFYSDESLFKALHFLLASGLLVVKEAEGAGPGERLNLFQKIRQQFDRKTHLERFDLMAAITNVVATRQDQVYGDFLSILGLEPEPADAELVRLHKELARMAREAYDAVQSGGGPDREVTMKGEAEARLKASTMYDEAQNHLQKGMLKEALALLQKVAQIDPSMERLPLYLAWAKLGLAEQSKNKAMILKEVDMDLMKVTPEDKFDGLYHFVLGLYAKGKGDWNGAKKSIEKAIAMDPNFIVARRELGVISTKAKAQKDQGAGDLKSLVGNLFGRKK